MVLGACAGSARFKEVIRRPRCRADQASIRHSSRWRTPRGGASSICCARSRNEPAIWRRPWTSVRRGLSRHLRTLRRSGLIEDGGVDHDARVSLYRLKPEPFETLRDWLDQVERVLDRGARLLQAHAERTRRKSR